MFFLVYVSTGTWQFSRDDLGDLLAMSRENNSGAGITGLLLYKDGNFMQLLEGEEGAVRALYHKIGLDPRNKGVLPLLHGFVDERQFPDWSMGFRDLNSPEIHATPGYSDFLNTPLTGREFSGEPSRAQKLLLTFKRTM